MISNATTLEVQFVFPVFDYSSVNILHLPVDAAAAVMDALLRLIRLIVGNEDTFAGNRPSRVQKEKCSISGVRIKLHNALLIV